MKRTGFLLLLISILSTAEFVFPQSKTKWYQFNCDNTEKINYMTPDYAVGNNGTFLKRKPDDSGWQRINLGINNDLTSIYASGPLFYITGSGGLVLKSTNSGNSWINVSTGQNEYIKRGAGFTNSGTDYFFIVCRSGKIYRTTNGGTDWIQIPSGTNEELRAVAFGKSIVTGTVYGVAVGTNGTVITSTNYGQNWEALNTMQTVNYNDVVFRDSSSTLIVGDNGSYIGVYRTNGYWHRVINNLNVEKNFNTISSFGNWNTPQIMAGDEGNCFIFKNYNYSFENTYFNYNFTACACDSNRYYLSADNGKILVGTFDSLFYNVYSLSANNILTHLKDNGVFNNGYLYPTGGGFIWPKDLGKYSFFTSGFNICAMMNNQLRMAASSYGSEFAKGYCSYGMFNTDSRFKLYRIRKGDTESNYDYAHWADMVPFGAPYFDRNLNGIYDAGIDLPGMKNADETLFLCMSDANPTLHNTNTGFGGATFPLNAEIHMSMWSYNFGLMKDVNFIKIEFFNKSPLYETYIWNLTRAGFYVDFDFESGVSDAMASDSARNLAIAYSYRDSTGFFGSHPPAAGLTLLKGVSLEGKNLKSTSITRLNHGETTVYCETEPEGDAPGAYNLLKGLKKDGTKWIVPNSYPASPTKYVFSGDPETNSGWTYFKGRLNNCGDSVSGSVIPEYTGDKKFLISTGSDNLMILPGQSQVIYAAQMIARGTSNLNSVTKLKELCDSVIAFYENGFPVPGDTLNILPIGYFLHQNYPNPFNASTRIFFDLPQQDNASLKVYDVTGRLVATLFDGRLNTGRYEFIWNAKNFSSGVYFYKLNTTGYSKVLKMVLIK